MHRLLAKFVRWWETPHRPPAAGVPYRVVCACGQVAAGSRQDTFQVIRCSACGAERFILPRSPLPPVAGPVRLSSPHASAAWFPPSRGLTFLAAGALALLVAAAALTWMLTARSPAEKSSASPDPARARGPDASLDTARQLLGRGQLHQARAQAEAVLRFAAGRPGFLAADDRRAVEQVQREAALLAELSAESLEEILGHAAALPDEEWEATFRQRYQGKALVLDLEVVRNTEGRYRHGWRLFFPNGNASLELEGLQLLEGMPLETPRRLVLGARLGSARREPPGTWVVRLAPDSGVLLTDPGAAALCCPALGDAAARDVLERQRGWVLGKSASGKGGPAPKPQ
jgi:hypothetical protein